MSLHGSPSAAPARTNRLQQLAWNIRREFWEHRSLYLAPAVVAILILVGYVYACYRMHVELPKLSTLPRAMQAAAIAPFYAAAVAMMATVTLTSLAYCVDTLASDRRDRSILFWKSLPLSEADSVLAKAAVPLLAMIPFESAMILITLASMFIAGSAFFAFSGLGVDFLFNAVRWADLASLATYGVFTATLWYAPIYAWFLMWSAAVKRGAALWGGMPLVAAIAERVTGSGDRVQSLLKERLLGAGDFAFVTRAPAAAKDAASKLIEPAPLYTPAPLKFFSSTEFWTGLLFAAAFIAIAIYLRRRQSSF